MTKEKRDLALYNKAKALDVQIKTLESELSAVKAEIIQRMTDKQLLLNGTKLAWLTTVKGVVTVDVQRLQQEKPEIFAEYKKEGQPFDKFYLKK